MKRLIPLALIVPLAVAGCSSSSKTNAGTQSTTTLSSGSPTTMGSTATTAPAANMATANPTAPVTVTEAGSSLLYPYLEQITPGLTTAYSNVKLSSAAGGSGAGIADAINGTTDLGGSDAYLSPSEFSGNPGLLNIPIVVSSQDVDYNLSGITGLKLSGDVLAQIYEGKITSWNNPAITALNPGVTLPDEPIVPVRRSDSSGDTFLFTSYLSKTNPTWSSTVSYNTKVNWPSVSNEKDADGNSGMVQTCGATPGCIAYIGISSQAKALAAHLSPAELENASGAYISNSPSSVLAAVSAGTTSLPANLAQPLIYEPGADAYPIVNFEYIVVKTSQSSSSTAQAIRDFLAYAISPTGGSSPTNLAAEQFQALPSSAIGPVESAIASIQ